jgi:predicted nucleic acid-binding protein
MATVDVKHALFLDTNILIYASIKEAPEHQAVRAFVEKQLANATPLYISRQVLREYTVDFARFAPRLKLINPCL